MLPDSISWHFYGRDCKLEGIQGVSGDGENFSVYRSAILNALTASQNGTSENDSARYDLSTMQQHLNEFNIYVPLGEDSRDTWNTVKVVPAMFDAMETLLAANDITRVNWATFFRADERDRLQRNRPVFPPTVPRLSCQLDVRPSPGGQNRSSRARRLVRDGSR